MSMLKTLIILIFLLTCFGISLAEIDVDSILILNEGGFEAFEQIKKIKTIRTRGDIIVNKGMPMEYEMLYMYPDKLLITYQLGIVNTKVLLNDGVAKQIDLNGVVTELTGFEKQELLRHLYFVSYSYILPDLLPGSKKYVDRLTLDNGTEVHQIDIYPLNKDTVTYFIDVEKNEVILQKSKSAGIDYTIKNFEYIEVEGIKFIKYSKSLSEDNEIIIEYSLDHVEVNKKVEIDSFELNAKEIKEYYFPESFSELTFPVKYANNQIYIKAQVNGYRKLLFMLDTGASGSMLNYSIFKNYRLKPIAELPAHGIGGFENYSLVSVDKIQFDSIQVFDQIMGMIELKKYGLGPKETNIFGGILGFDVLSKFPFLIDYKNEKITFYNPNKFFPEENYKSIKISRTKNIPTAQATIAGFDGDFLVDLGNSFSIIINSHFYNKIKDEPSIVSFPEETQEIWGIGGSVKVASGNTDKIRIDDLEIENADFLYSETRDNVGGTSTVDGNIGNGILENFKVLFDYQNDRILIYDY